MRAALEGQIAAMHWDENLADRDSFQALGQGNIDWQEVFRFAAGLPTQPLITLEVGSLPTTLDSLIYLIDQGMLPTPDV